MAPAEDYVSWDTKTPNKIRMGTEAPANYAPLCIQNMMRNTVKEYPDNKVGWKYLSKEAHNGKTKFGKLLTVLDLII